MLEGGGVKGIGLVGAVLTLHDAGLRVPACRRDERGRDHRRARRRVAGGREAALAARGVRQLGRLPEVPGRGVGATTTSVRSGDIAELLLHMGIHSGDYLVEWLGGILEEIGITTFEQLRMDDPGSSLPEASPLLAHRAHRRHHPPQGRPPPVGLRQLRARPRPATHRRRGARVDVDPVLLRTRRSCTHRRPPTTV